jgi:hypothetical protein
MSKLRKSGGRGVLSYEKDVVLNDPIFLLAYPVLAPQYGGAALSAAVLNGRRPKARGTMGPGADCKYACARFDSDKLVSQRDVAGGPRIGRAAVGFARDLPAS